MGKEKEPCIPREELVEKRPLIRELTIDNFLDRTEEVEDVLARPRTSGIGTLGYEIELPLERNGEPHPGYSDVAAWVRENRPELADCVSPEFLETVVEGKSRFPVSFDDDTNAMAANIASLVEPIYQAAVALGIDVLNLSSFPAFDQRRATEHMNPEHNRYLSIKQNIDPLGHNHGVVPLVKGTPHQISGVEWQGNTAGIHINYALDGNVFEYLTAQTMLAPVFTALTGSSPIVEGHLSALDSLRTRVMPIAFYEAPPEDRRNKWGRWNDMPFMLIGDEDISQFVDMEAYEIFRNAGRSEAISRLGAFETFYLPFLVTSEDLNSGKLDRAQVWTPGGKIKYDADPVEGGVLMEIRTGIENGASPSVLASQGIAYLAMVDALATRLIQGETPITGMQHSINMDASALHAAKLGGMHWIGGRKSLQEILYGLIEPANNFLQERGRGEEERRDILNSITSRAGLYLGKRGNVFKGSAVNSPAEDIRAVVLESQPDAVRGYRVRPDVIAKATEPFKTINLPVTTVLPPQDLKPQQYAVA